MTSILNNISTTIAAVAFAVATVVARAVAAVTAAVPRLPLLHTGAEPLNNQFFSHGPNHAFATTAEM